MTELPCIKCGTQTKTWINDLHSWVCSKCAWISTPQPIPPDINLKEQ